MHRIASVPDIATEKSPLKSHPTTRRERIFYSYIPVVLAITLMTLATLSLLDAIRRARLGTSCQGTCFELKGMEFMAALVTSILACLAYATPCPCYRTSKQRFFANSSLEGEVKTQEVSRLAV